MRFLVLSVLLLVASACRPDGGSGSSTHGTVGSSSHSGRDSRDALVYAAVIRQLVTYDHGFGGAPSPYRRIYVLDGAVQGAANPARLTNHAGNPFGDGLRRQIMADMKGLPPIAFTETRGAVITGSALGHVIHRGVLITLGPIKWVDAHTARVGNNRWATALNGQWLTYSVKLQNSTWKITGTVGSVAIS